MGKLHQIGKIIIRVYANDHLPPHFHAVHPDFEALIHIETLSLLRGSLSPQATKAVMAWAAAIKTAIVAEWNRVNPRFLSSEEPPMTHPLPRIAKVAVAGPTCLLVRWKNGGTDQVDLAGWIATGGDMLAPLRDPDHFRRAVPGEYGASVAWDDDDLAIDAVHLEALAAEQRPFGADDMAAWQAAVGWSNQEAADFLAVSLSTWHTYKNGARIPPVVAMACRAALRDPVLLQAHYRPRKTGRPKTAARA